MMTANGLHDCGDATEWSDVIVAAMKLGGVDNLFFVSGSELNFYQEAIAKAHARGTPAPRLVTVTHENVALNAALGNAMARNQPAATAVHVDAGTLHQGAAVHSAWRGNYPVLMTAGTGPRAYPGSMPGARDNTVQSMQEPRDQGEIVRQYTKIDHRMEHQDQPGLIISRLLQVAMSQPRGPVYLSIPRETAMLPARGVTTFLTRDALGVARPVSPDWSDAEQIADWLLAAEQPVICVERSGRDPGAVLELVELAELLSIPIVENTAADRMNFPADHWAYGTGPAIAEADVVLVMDAVVPYVAGAGSPAPTAKVAWVTPDPVLSRYKTVEHRADIWIPCDAGAAASAIRAALIDRVKPHHQRQIVERRERLRARKAALVAAAQARVDDDLRAGRLTGRLVGYQLGRVLEPEAIVLNDGLSNGGHVHASARRTRFGTYFRSGSTSGGWGSGAAFGVKLAAPDRDVIHASGDGYFMFGEPLSALWAAAHHGAAYMSVVFVNGTYSTGTTSLRRTYPDGYGVAAGYDGGTFLPAPNFAKVAEAVNCFGVEVFDVAELGSALRDGLRHTRDGTPAVIAAHVPGPV